MVKRCLCSRINQQLGQEKGIKVSIFTVHIFHISPVFSVNLNRGKDLMNNKIVFHFRVSPVKKHEGCCPLTDLYASDQQHESQNIKSQKTLQCLIQKRSAFINQPRQTELRKRLFQVATYYRLFMNDECKNRGFHVLSCRLVSFRVLFSLFYV